MDYDALYQTLPLSPKQWTSLHVSKWLHFIGLSQLARPFEKSNVNGQSLFKINQQRLQNFGIKSKITKYKMMRWVTEGLKDYEKYLVNLKFDNKENIPPQQLQRKQTVQTMNQKDKYQRYQHNEDGMIIRSCDGNIAANYVMKNQNMKIGRSQVNIIRSLEVSVEDEHAQLAKFDGKYFIRDKGTEAGTFIKITTARVLTVGTLIEMGSFLLKIKSIKAESKNIFLQIFHMSNLENKGDISISFSDNCSSFTFGRRKNNDFYADDQHLSSLHAKIFMQRGNFVIEDMHSTNGTWLRLSKPKQSSDYFQLEEYYIFKVGTTITYQCLLPEKKQQKMDIEYQESCIGCQKQKRNILFLPCKHNLVCQFCKPEISHCPLCSCEVNQTIKMFT